ncbi:MAG: T9SS type A sorting domain-containing protein [Ignavibacteriota bacterium]
MKKFFVVVLILVAMNAKAQWVQMSNGMGSDRSVFSIISVENNILVGTNWYGIYLSTNYGTSWSQTSANYQWVYSFASIANNIVAGTYDSAVYLSTNNGSNWTHLPLSNKTVWSLLTLGSDLLAGISDSGIYRSTNNGFTWIRTDLNNRIVYSIAAFGTNIVAGTWHHGVYLSTNNGINWVQTDLNNVTVRAFTTHGTNLFAGTDSGLYRSTSNGINWTRIAFFNQPVYSLASSGNNIFAGIYYNGIYLSTNDGINWLSKSEGLNVYTTVDVFLIANNYIYAGTWVNSIWRRSLAEILGVQYISTETPSKYSLSQNYPNPFNPTTKIKIDIARSGDVKIVVYDVMGREVQTLVNESLKPGTYEVSFDGSMLNSGVYFYKLIIDGFTETKKMLLIK